MNLRYLDLYDTKEALFGSLKDYVKIDRNDHFFESTVTLSNLGFSFLSYRSVRIRDHWLPFAISTAIAILSLVFSVIALFAK